MTCGNDRGAFLRISCGVMLNGRCLFYFFDYNHNSLFPLQSEGCGWGAVALEPLEKGDFIIEYVGEGTNYSATLNICLTEIANSF